MGIGASGWNEPSWREVGQAQAAAPVTAKFLTQQPDGTLTGEQALSLLATGLMKSTTGTGVVSIAVANTDYAHPGATYVVKTSTNAPPNAQILAALGTGIMKNANGTGVVSIAVSNDDFAAPGATYVVKTASAAPTNAQILASLATGLVKNTTATGVLSIAVGGTDYVVPGGVAGGQTIVGGTAASETLTLRSTSDATKGSIIVGTTSGVVFDGLNSNLMIGHSTVVAPTRLSVLGSATVASATSATWNGVDFIASTLTWSGSTAVTTAAGVNFVVFRQPTITAASGVATTVAATVKIAGPPIAGGSATITKGLALWVGGNTACARFGDGTGDVSIEGSTTYSSGTAQQILAVVNMGSGNRVALGASASLSLNPNGHALLNSTTDANSWLRINAAATLASATSLAWDGGMDIMAATLTLSGSTAITTATGVNLVNIAAPTISAASALAVTAAATVYIGGAPIAAGAGPATITNAYGLWSKGITRLDADVVIGGLLAGPTFSAGHGLHISGTPQTTFRMTTSGKSYELSVDGGAGFNFYDATAGAVRWSILTTGEIGMGVAPATNTQLTIGGNRAVTSAAGATWDGVGHIGGTLTISGSTNITTATGLNYFSITRPTYSNASIAISLASTVYISGAPAVTGGATITAAYAVWIDSGLLRYDGAVALGGGAAPTVGTIGGSGPATAAQNQWLPINVDGNARFIPLWA